jgi:methylase of polypeptide subunit release factors
MFVEGLTAIPRNAIEGKKVVEIGIGTGVIPVALHLLGLEFRQYFGYDIDTLAARVACLNIEYQRISERVHVRGGGTMFEPERGLIDEGQPYADLIIANVPQVPSLSTGPIRDQFDYYYMPVTLRGEEESWAMQGLWLVAEILRQAKSRLLPGGSVVVNIGGRPTLQHIEEMFWRLGYKPKVVHKRRVLQDAETDISALAYFERTRGIEYEFYTDKARNAKISASRAYDRLANRQACYHDIFVIQGVPES